MRKPQCSANFRSLPFEPYAPVRRQLLNLLRAVNRERGRAGFELLTTSALRLSRRGVKPFAETLDQTASAVASAFQRALSVAPI